MGVSAPSGNTIVLAIAAIVCLLIAAFTGLALTGNESDRTPLITTLVGLLAPTMVGLMALLRSDASVKKVEELDNKVTSVQSSNIANAVALGRAGEQTRDPNSPEARKELEEVYERLRVQLEKQPYEP